MKTDKDRLFVMWAMLIMAGMISLAWSWRTGDGSTMPAIILSLAAVGIATSQYRKNK